MADLKEKTYVEDVDRSVYDMRDAENDAYRMESGLTPEIVEKLSKEKDDPVWMQQFRLESLQIYNEMKIPNWGPSIEGLDMDHIATYVRPNTKMRNDWKDVPEDIKETFERLGIPQAERKSLAGVGAQYDSELVYHNVKDSVAAEGVVYTDMESAMKGEYADMVRKYFMKLVTPHDHKFAALHGAVWSGGSFVYVPKGVHLSIPLQSYFRLNAKGAGQFEHTLIIVDEGASLHFIEGCSAPKYNVANLHAGCVELYVKKGAKLRYSTIENWSKNMYNLNTKRALVEEGGTIEWISGSFGSHVGCLYPMSILKGDNSRMEFTGVTFAGAGQNLDTGAKVVHVGKNTSSYMNTRSISKSGGISTFRSSVVVEKGRQGRQVRRVVPVADAGLRVPFRHHPRNGHPHEGRGHRPRGQDRRDQQRSRLLSDEPRHERGRRARDDRQRLCRQCLQGAAGGVRGGNEQPHPARDERQHWLKGVWT